MTLDSNICSEICTVLGAYWGTERFWAVQGHGETGNSGGGVEEPWAKQNLMPQSVDLKIPSPGALKAALISKWCKCNFERVPHVSSVFLLWFKDSNHLMFFILERRVFLYSNAVNCSKHLGHPNGIVTKDIIVSASCPAFIFCPLFSHLQVQILLGKKTPKALQLSFKAFT